MQFAEALSGFQIDYLHIPALGGLRGRRLDVPREANAFWKNQSFHNYAGYALSPEFRSGLEPMRELGQQRTARQCAPTPIILSRRAKPFI